MNYNKMSDNAKIKALDAKIEEMHAMIGKIEEKYERLRQEELKPIYAEFDKVLAEQKILKAKNLENCVGKAYKEKDNTAYFYILNKKSDTEVTAIKTTSISVSACYLKGNQVTDLEEITFDEYGNAFDKKIVDFKRKITNN